MTLFRAAMKRTCMAFAFRGFSEQGKLSNFVLRTSSNSVASSRRYLASSSFTPPVPPSSKGTPVYTDVDFNVADNLSSESYKRNNDPDAVFVVHGSSRGIGLQFVKSLMERTKGKIVACCRSPSTASELSDLAGRNSDRVRVVQLDVEDQQSIEDAGAVVRDAYGRVDLLLNVAGLLGDGNNTPGPERSLAKIERDWAEKSMAVNVIGPVMLAKEFAPLMKTKIRKKDADAGRPISLVANLSARVGSISDNGLGGWYSYRFSKAALNQATRTMSHELKRQGTWAVALHPGTTDTDLSKPFQGNVQEGRLFPVDFTVDQLLNVIDSMEEHNSGGLYDWAGTALPF